MVAYPTSIAKFYKTLKAAIWLFAVKNSIEQLNNLQFKCFSVMSVKNLCIQKYMKRKAKGSAVCRSVQKTFTFISFYFILFFWLGVCLKLETAHKFIESKKWINVMHICDYKGKLEGGGGGSWHFYHSCLYINSKAIYIRAILFKSKSRCNPLSHWAISPRF